MAERKTMSPELRLLFACARIQPDEADEAHIALVLGEGVDWTRLAQIAAGYGLAGLIGRTLARVAPAAVPGDILEAFRLNLDGTRDRNRALLHELQSVLARLASPDIEVIPIRGAVTGIQAYGDLGFRAFNDLDLLIRDRDVGPVIAALEDLGYERTEHFAEAQTTLIQRLRGQISLGPKAAGGAGLKIHTRLTPMRMAFDIDYPALWLRARQASLNGQPVKLLAPEDYLLVLAICGGKDMWRRLNAVSDIAAFLHRHPKLDWDAIIARSKAQGCLRMVIAAVSLAHKFFGAAIPQIIAAHAWPGLDNMMQRVAEGWSAEKATGSRNNSSSASPDYLQLHDGLIRQGRYLARTSFLPGPQHVAWIALPEKFSFAYVPLKFIYDFGWLPLSGLHAKLTHWLARPQVASCFSAKLRAERRVFKKARSEALRAIDANANDVVAWYNLGNALNGLERHQEAIACYDKGLAFAPDNAGIWRNRTAALEAIKKKTGSSDIAEIPPVDPESAASWGIRAGFLWSSRRFGEAIEAADAALQIDPEHVAAARIGIASRIYTCDWRAREQDKNLVSTRLRAGMRLIAPFSHRSVFDSEEEHLLLARLRSKECTPSNNLWRGERYAHDKIRVAYLSPDFRGHVVGRVIGDCFERHDRTRFETTAISLGRDDGSSTRKRLEAAFDRFVDVQKISDGGVANLLRDMEIDIAVDLAGYTQGGRNAILARRPAPVQVNWLGYPGTMGTSFMDYIVADRLVIPPENHIHYTEKVVYLPHSYLPHDSKRAIPEGKITRTDAGLPENAFVFACLNDTHKISPEVFEIWMRLLQAVEGSVLWLRSANAGAMVNLRREAESRGISAERILYAVFVKQPEEYLARLGLADLFLDTLPYNAHATAIDALWAGLPVLTCPGRAFPGRVAASLLMSVGLPELVTSSAREYEELALALARDPERLARIKAKLLQNRSTEPLFDTARFTRDLERAYTMMWERYQKGEPPASFAVPAN